MSEPADHPADVHLTWDDIIADSPAQVHIYKSGLFSMSVCAPAAMDGDAVAAMASAQEPTGIDRDWTVSADATFGDGVTPNPCPCNTMPDARRHWLLDC